MGTEKKAPSRSARGWDAAADATTGARAIASLAARGDLSGLGPADRARLYVQVCEALGLNPHAQPFAFLRLGGKEVLYATRGATDQLAAIHRLTREIVDGPRVIELAGVKLVFAVCKVSHPNGRVETSVATVALADPVNALMRVETKAKRRATLSILGLAILDETEADAGDAKGEGVDLSHAEAPRGDGEAPPRGEVPVDAPAPDAAVDPPPPEVPAALEGFYSRLPDLEAAADAVRLWVKHRPAVAQVAKRDAEAAFAALALRAGQLGAQDARRWLKRALADHDAGAQAAPAKAQPAKASRAQAAQGATP